MFFTCCTILLLTYIYASPTFTPQERFRDVPIDTDSVYQQVAYSFQWEQPNQQQQQQQQFNDNDLDNISTSKPIPIPATLPPHLRTQIQQQQHQQQQQQQQEMYLQQTTTDPTDTTPPPIIGDPIGFIPLRHMNNQSVYLVDIAMGSNAVSRLNSLILDTTGELLLTLSQAVCDSLTPPIQHCVTPNLIFQTPFTTANWNINTQNYYCTQCFVGSDRVSILWSRDGTSLISTSADIDVIVSLALKINGTEMNPPLFNIAPFRGLFGLGAPSSRSRPATGGDYRRPFADLLQYLINSWQLYPDSSTLPTTFSYGLDLYLSPSNATSQSISSSNYPKYTQRMIATQSKLYLNGIPEQFQSRMQWALHPASYRAITPPVPTNDDDKTPTTAQRQVAYPIFIMYNIKVCNNLLYTQLPVIVDTMSPCLTVPQPLFDSLISWLPLECDWTINEEDGNRQCYYTSNTLSTAKLPTLQFSLSSQDTKTTPQPQLYLPLEQLLLSQFYMPPPLSTTPPSNFTGAQRLCLATQPNFLYINLGNIPLSSFYFHRDFQTGYLGLANKAATEPSLSQCLPRLQCIGQESSYPTYNYCYPPDCSAYWFFSYGHSTRTCKLSPAYPILLAAAILIFFAWEAWLYYSEDRLDYSITHTMPKMTLVQRSESRRYQQQQQQQQAPPGN